MTNKWDDPEYRKAYFCKYGEAHREERREYAKAYRVANLEKLRAKDRAYTATHREEARIRALAWYQAHKARPGRNASPEIRFWRQVNKTDTCWLWTGTPARGGYGQIKIAGRRVLAHRFSWELHFGPIPEGHDMLHTCDNPPCIRPDHLWTGTHADNMQDMVLKGRSRCQNNHP